MGYYTKPIMKSYPDNFVTEIHEISLSLSLITLTNLRHINACTLVTNSCAIFLPYM